MLPLLLAALGAPGAAPFVLQVASWCSPVPDASAAAASNASWPLLVALSQMPLLCGDLRGDSARPCAPRGPLGALADGLARTLSRDPRWGQRVRERRRLCAELPGALREPRRAPPRLLILPERSGPALTLTCHAWGFSPAEVTLRWLRNGDVVGDPPGGPTRALPAGDGTFRARATLEVAPGTAGDTFVCSALQPGLEEPVSVTWTPGLSPNLSLLVALAVLVLGLGLLLFVFGLCRYLSPAAAAAGYSPLPGDTYAGSI